MGFSRETAETLGNLGLKPKLGFQSTATPVNVPYGNFITRLEYKGFTVFRGSKKQVEALAEKLKNMGDDAAVKYVYDQLMKNAKNFKLNDEELYHAFIYFDAEYLYQLEIRNIKIPK